MAMLINGQHNELVSAYDRGLAYGDGAFETVLTVNGRPVFWREHLDRLTAACETLAIPLATEVLESEALQYLAGQAAERLVLKLVVTRGTGGRGYVPPVSPEPLRMVQLHPFPNVYDRYQRDGVEICVCSHPVSRNRVLAGVKHLNRLDQVMASMELRDGIAEGLMFDDEGLLVEGTRSNVFLINKESLVTPDLSRAGVAGIMRAWIMQYCHEQKLTLSVTDLGIDDIYAADAVFVCNSVFGIWPVRQLTHDGHIVEWQRHPLLTQLQRASHQFFYPDSATPSESVR